MLGTGFAIRGGDGWTAWKPIGFVGINLIVLALLIFAFPALLAYLIAAFLLFNGSLLVGAACWLWQTEKQSRERHPVYWQ